MARRRPLSPKEKLHADWLGMLQPEGLVVSVPVLLDADAYVRQQPEVQAAVRDLAPDDRLPNRAAFDRVLAEILGWPEHRRADAATVESLAVALPDLGVVLRPDGALLDRDGKPILYVAWTDGKLDETAGDSRWPVSRQGRFERLLLESQTATGGGAAIGVHACPSAIRLTYAPRGEAPGSLSFPIDALCTWDGRVLVDALVMLLGRDRLYTVAAEHRLPALLAASRKRQEQVTVSLAGQVEEALAILVAGVDVANGRTRGALLRDLGGESAVPVRDALVTVLLRLVFLLYCEDGGVLPTDHPLYLDNYSLARLVEKLEEDRVLYPEAMRHRYGAWARLCALFRLVHRGIRHGDLVLPPRQGDLFDPDRHPFLEGRVSEHDEAGTLAPIDDGVVLDVLERLVYLENQRLSYRNLDVEQIGSVYEALMGLEVRRVGTRTVPVRGGGWLELGEALDDDQPLRVVARAAGVKDKDLLKRAPGLAEFETTGDRAVDEAALVAALGSLIDDGRPERKPGQHVLVGGAERRRTGSHYTPTALTRPIVERTLAPVLDKDGPPSSERILDMKVCDPAMGSGAFLAEACRYLARRLLDAWTREGRLPAQARDRDPLLLARRMVAERCLYGVDKNPFAVQLARLSLWLVTLAKDQPFTFVDHALREGDAVIGLTPEQIAAFSFEPPKKQDNLFAHAIRRSIKDAIRDRAQITAAAPLFDFRDEHRWKVQYLTRAQDEVYMARRRGDLLLALAWAGGKGKEAKEREGRVRLSADNYFLSDGDKRLSDEGEALLGLVDELPLRPFHWALDFPEVFGRENPGFDAVVGNPPFGGEMSVRAGRGGVQVAALLRLAWPRVQGKSDFVVYFFLRAAGVLRRGGCFGLVATNTIKQGDTRASGLQPLMADGINVYDAATDTPWPVLGGAAVVVDVVHACVGPWAAKARLNGRDVDAINSSLQADDEVSDPVVLGENTDRAFRGTSVLGAGFLIDPREAGQLLEREPSHTVIIRPYIGGEELNSNPPDDAGHVQYDRYVLDFGNRPLEECRQWPELIAIVEDRVMPERTRRREDGSFVLRAPLPERWWQFNDRRPGLYRAIAGLRRCLAGSQVSKHHLLGFQPTDRVFSHALNVFAFDDYFSFAVLQSRVHEAWARSANLGSTLETRNRYTPSTVFETFPFPRPRYDAERVAAATAGEALDTQRTLCMRRFNEGMTKIWNRLLDPDEQTAEILKLRDLRDSMDRAVLAAYGWSDLAPDATAEIVKRLRALNAERAAEEKRRA